MPKLDERLFTRQHYNAIAKDIRESYMTHSSIDLPEYRMANRTLEELAIKFAERFSTDNSAFDPIQFLDACSPDPLRYPFSELWDADNFDRVKNATR